MTVVPRYESSSKYPSARTAGFNIVDRDNIIVVGLGREQLAALLSRQDPSAETEVKLSDADQKMAGGQNWRTLTGETMSEEQFKSSLKIGFIHARGKKVSLLIERAVDVYSHLRIGTMAMVLIDWE